MSKERRFFRVQIMKTYVWQVEQQNINLIIVSHKRPIYKKKHSVYLLYNEVNNNMSFDL